MFVPSVLQVLNYVEKLMNVCSVNDIHELVFGRCKSDLLKFEPELDSGETVLLDTGSTLIMIYLSAFALSPILLGILEIVKK